MTEIPEDIMTKAREAAADMFPTSRPAERVFANIIARAIQEERERWKPIIWGEDGEEIGMQWKNAIVTFNVDEGVAYCINGASGPWVSGQYDANKDQVAAAAEIADAILKGEQP